MPQIHGFQPIVGSERHPLENARVSGPVDPEKPIRLTVYVRPQAASTPVPSLQEIGHGPYRPMDPAERQEQLDGFNADPQDLKAVEAFAQANNLKVLESSETKRSVLVEGKTGDAARAFGVDLQIWEYSGDRYRGRTGPIHVPAPLHDLVEAVFGFDNRPTGRPLMKRSRRRFVSRAAQPNVFKPTELASLYSFPGGMDGSGETIAIMSFNGVLGDTGETALGGYSSDLLQRYFTKELGLEMPEITSVVVHGPGNAPGDGTQRTDTTGEVLLDICTVWAVAPKAKLVMYFTEFTEQGWVDGIMAIVTAANQPSVISISYGNPEDGPSGEILWTQQAISKVNEAFHRAALAGITICCASGDQGSTELLPDHLQHVDFPASSPWVLGCGGTRVTAAQGVITREIVWNDGPTSATGGGISRLFALPSYQAEARVPPSVNPGHRLGRGVPDVSADADPETGVLVVFPDGSVQPLGGTSASAPLWAGLIALLSQALGRPVGFLNPVLYKTMSNGVLRDITEGDNGAYRAGPGWDACTGLGSPNGIRLLTALQGVVA